MFMTKIISENLKKNIGHAIAPGVIIGLFLALGNVVKREHGFKFSALWLMSCLFICAVSVFAITLIYTLWDRRNSRLAEPAQKVYMPNKLFKKSWVYFFVMLAVLLIMWLPALLALYPGIYAYDASWQYDMYVQGKVTAHHPVIHTYLVGWLIDTVYRATGAFNKGILANTLAQELLMGLGCAYIFYEFHRRKAATWIHVFALVFFALYPPFVLFVFSSTKDSIFAIAVADIVLLSLSMAENIGGFFEKRANRVLWIVFALEIAILRNNSVYAVVLTLPFIIVMFAKAKEIRAKAFRTLAIATGIFLIYKYPITNALTVENVSKAEMLSVPSQQIMRVYFGHTEEISSEDDALVKHLFGGQNWPFDYNPYIADITKGNLTDEALNEEFGEFKGLWVKWLKEYPGEYIDAFLENTYGFWYPMPIYVLYSLGGEGYTPVTVRGPGEQNSKIPGLLEFYKLFEDSKVVMGSGMLSVLFAPATFLYIAITVAFYLLKTKKKAVLIPFVYLGLLWLTYLLGPVAMVRYALYLFALLPVWPEYVRSKATRKTCEIAGGDDV